MSDHQSLTGSATSSPSTTTESVPSTHIRVQTSSSSPSSSSSPVTTTTAGSHHDWGKTHVAYDKYITPVTLLHSHTLVSAITSILSSQSPNDRITILDIGCGSGSVALSYLRHFPQGSSNHTFICSDVAKEMVEHTQRRIELYTKTMSVKTNFKFLVSEGARLEELEDSSIDIIIAAFTIFHASDDSAFLTNVRRLLKPDKNARFLLTAWTDESKITESVSPESPLKLGCWFLSIFDEAASRLVRDCNLQMNRHEIFPWFNPSEAMSRLEQNGFRSPVLYPSIHSVLMPSANDLWTMATTALPYISTDGLDPDAVQAVKKDVIAYINGTQSDPLVKGNVDLIDHRPILVQTAANIYVVQGG